ncbi:MAG: hypothetical protein FWB83_04550 [Treponema sp.]|nr:hypothetical protein [Treponema sp.]
MNKLSACPLLVLLFMYTCFSTYGQPVFSDLLQGDAAAAQRYVNWARTAINEGRNREALAALQRASDFADVSSDVSYLLAVARLSFLNENETRITVVQALDRAVQTRRWVNYNEGQALLLKAEQLTAMRDYSGVIRCLNHLREADGFPFTQQMAADAAMLQLLTLRGMAFSGRAEYDSVNALSQFRSQMLSAMDRYPRDPRPLKIFFEYARNRNPEISGLQESDVNLLELVLRRLPFLLERDPELAWMAAPFMRDIEAARRLTASYRSGSLSSGSFKPAAASIPAALNLGLIDDRDAVDELFDLNSDNAELQLDKNILTDVYALLRSEEGRDYFTRALLSFSGVIYSDDDRDGYIDSRASYRDGIIQEYEFDMIQSCAFDTRIVLESVPVYAVVPVSGLNGYAHVSWERYPSVDNTVLVISGRRETYRFRPADFQYAPVEFLEIGGSGALAGLLYLAPASSLTGLTRRALVSNSSAITRASVEIAGAEETFYMERGIPLRSVETLNGQNVSLTEFERGYPVIQYIDLDQDGRMETIRRFRLPSSDLQFLDYHSLRKSSQSDWSGDGRFMTGELYLEDGSVVYTWDMDGSGQMNYSQSGNQ